ncbi:MAG: DUF1853 family protein [Salibacteraceae bacterium]
MEFNTKEVRDLAWVIQSPELSFFEGYKYSINTDNRALNYLEKLDADPSELLDYLELNKESKRLGKYFELLLNYHFLNDIGICEVKKGIQIQYNKRTLGELDFLIKPKGYADWIHLEVAVKFYLAFVKNGTTHFIGPNSKDTFRRKKKKLINRQIDLSNSEESMQQLGDVSIGKRAVIMKGYVFVNRFLPEQLDLTEINEYCLKGWWCNLDDFINNTESNQMYSVLNKLDWLSGFIGSENSIYSFENLVDLVKQRILELPLMLAVVEEKSPSLYVEISRGVLVNLDWPNVEL